MPAQTVLFTAIPDGVGARRRVRLLVHVGPRLLSAGKLGDFDGWVDWPATIAQLGPWELRFPGLGAQYTVQAHLSTDVIPDPAVWARLFPADTPVHGRRMPKLTNRLLHTYSTETISTFLRQRWGRFGSESPEQFPSLAALLDDDGFGAFAFDRLKRDVHETGPQRRDRLVLEHFAQLDAAAPTPDRWAIAHKPLPVDATERRDEIGRRFVELEHFHVRGRRGPQPDMLPEKHHEPTFHELVAMVQRYPRLLRALGLVLALEADLTTSHVHAGTPIQVVNTTVPAVQRPVFARTMSAVGSTVFRAIPDPNGDKDLVGRQLKLGDPRFRVDTVDPDAGALRAMQFADNVARSHPDLIDDSRPASAYTADEFALPAPVSGGIAVSRVHRANRLAHLLQRVKQTNDSVYDPLTGLPFDPPLPPLFWADDLVRGYRWDVKATSDGRWRSLMEYDPAGSIEVGDDGDTVVVAADEEAVSSTGVTSAGGATPAEDLYAHESLMHWGGWSLAARRPGATVGRDDDVADPDVPVAPDGSTPARLAPINARLTAKPGSLPRLRFGETYRVRARAVDIAGGSDRLDGPTEAGAESSAVEYRRFEPVSAPVAALQHPAAIPGETNTVVVVRSENAADVTHAQNHRHLVPPRTNIGVVERHGLLDIDQAGRPLDPQALANLGQRDAQDLSTHPDIQPPDANGPTDARWFPVTNLTLNYLADPLAKRVLVRDLPVVAGVTEQALDLAIAAWPQWSTAGVTVETADVTGWNVQDGTLVVRLAKGEDRFVRVGSQFDDADVDLMGLWPWIAEWHLGHGGTQASLAALRAQIAGGRHWMFTPHGTLRLVHAVRTPLLAPTLPEAGFSAAKDGATPSATFANLRWKGAYSRRSTAQLDIVADWSMKIDNGPRTGPDPTVPQSFRTVAATIPLDHRSAGADVGDFRAKHEFGDTRYRSVRYHAVATSAFTEFFREEIEVTAPGVDGAGKPLPIPIDDRGIEAATVVVKRGGVELRQAPAAEYTVDEIGGALLRGSSSSIVAGDVLTVSYVAAPIHTQSAIRTREIRSSARPASPKIEYVLPTFRWQRAGSTSTRRGNSLRVYLQRPWWSSGDDERLGVVVWRKPATAVDPEARLKPYVTMWGLDPVFEAPGLATTPTMSSFPLAVDPGATANKELAELAGVTVDIAAHDVRFDATRDLWYCDIQLDFGNQAKAYFPFVRLALCRYQPHSMPGRETSSVVLADFAQVAPDRTVTVTGSGSTRTVTVTGRSYSSNSSANEPSRMQVVVERVRDDVVVDDPHLKWQQVGSAVALGRSVSDGNLITWTRTVNLGTAAGPRRLVVEEVEVHRVGKVLEAVSGPAGRRIVFTDIVNL